MWRHMFHNYLNTLDMMAARLATWLLGILFSAGLTPLAPVPAWAAEAGIHTVWSTPLLLLLTVGLGFLLTIALLQNRFLHRRLQKQEKEPSSGRAVPSAGGNADDLLHDAVFHNVGAGILIVENNGLISRANEEFALLTVICAKRWRARCRGPSWCPLGDSTRCWSTPRSGGSTPWPHPAHMKPSSSAGTANRCMPRSSSRRFSTPNRPLCPFSTSRRGNRPKKN